MASAGVDPLETLRQALLLPTDSPEQANVLSGLRETLENVPPGVTTLLLKQLVPNVQQQSDSIFKQWVFDLVWYIVCRAPLNIQERTRLALDFLDPLIELLADANPFYVKLAMQTLATAYPQVFRICCVDPSQRVYWLKMVDVRQRISDYNIHPTTPLGVRLASIKFLQRVILVHSKGVSDPRLHKPEDPHLAFCPEHHPFLDPIALKAEGHKVTEQCLRVFLSSKNYDVITAMVQSFGLVAKLRTDLIEFVYTAFLRWTPTLLTGDSLTAVRSVYKTMRIALTHLVRTQPHGPHRMPIEDAVRKLDGKLQEAFPKPEDGRRKRPLVPEQLIPPARPLVQSAPFGQAKPHKPVDPTILANFDFSTLSTNALAEIVVESLKLITEEHLDRAIEAWRNSRPMSVAAADPALNEAVLEEVVIKEEPIDPMIMAFDEEPQLEPPRPGIDAIEPETELRALGTFKLPRPRQMPQKQRLILVESCLQRVQKRGEDHAQVGKPKSSSKSAPPHMWTILLVRMITRGASSSLEDDEEDDEERPEGDMDIDGQKEVAVRLKPSREAALKQQYQMRRKIYEYITADFVSRYPIATIWLNEEWHNDRIKLRRQPSARDNYHYWVKEVLQAAADKGDRESFSRFVLDLPELSEDLFDLLRELAADKSRMPFAMAILRPLIELRVPLRDEGMSVLLELMTHPADATRKGAIHTVRRWWPDVQPMANKIQAYTKSCIERLAASEDSQDTESTSPLGRYLPQRPTIPADKAEITQFMEGSLALSVKDASFLEPLFQTYSTMDSSVQDSVQDLLVRPIQAIGPNNAKLLGFLKAYCEGAESLILKILNVFTEGSRPPPSIVEVVKYLLTDRGADPRFLVFIIGEMDKPEMLKYLPKLVSTLNGTPERRALIRQIFTSMVEITQNTNTNQVREGQSKLLTPKELMIQLHDMEDDVGLPKAKEAISICFNLPEIFKSEVLVSVMQHYLDAKTLPVLFVWTVLQAVATYKHLTGWVSTNLLSRLIVKKVWTNQQLWKGFILCAERTEPNSFNALLQLPKEQLRELVEKRPAMKVKLREWLAKRVGKDKAKTSGYWEILGDGEDA